MQPIQANQVHQLFTDLTTLLMSGERRTRHFTHPLFQGSKKAPAEVAFGLAKVLKELIKKHPRDIPCTDELAILLEAFVRALGEPHRQDQSEWMTGAVRRIGATHKNRSGDVMDIPFR
jgi:hypothetical protein